MWNKLESMNGNENLRRKIAAAKKFDEHRKAWEKKEVEGMEQRTGEL